MKKGWVVAGIVATVATGVSAAAVGTMAYGSRSLEESLRALAAPAAGQDLQVRQLAHEAGLASSHGSFEVALPSQCDEDGASVPLRAVVRYEASHLPLPGSAMRYTATLRAVGGKDDPLAELFGDRVIVSMHGDVGFGRTVSGAFELPEVALRGDGASVKVAASRGTVSFGANRLALDWNVDRITTRRPGQAAEATGIAMKLDLSDLRRGLGTSALKVERIEAEGTSVEGLSVVSDASEHAGAIDSRVVPSVRKLAVGGQQLRDLSLEVGVRGLDAAGFESMMKIATESCGFQSMTPAERRELQAAARAILQRGLSLEMPRFGGTADEGSVAGGFELKLAPAEKGASGTVIALERQLGASGRIELTGRMIDESQKKMAIDAGWAQPTDKGLLASFKYAAGQLTVNGKPDTNGIASMLGTGLAAADAGLLALLSDDGGAASAAPKAAAAAAPAAAPMAAADPVESPVRAADAAAPAVAPAPVAAAPAPAPAAADAPQSAAAAPAPAANGQDGSREAAAGLQFCSELQLCVDQTLRAAASEDIDRVRAIAARIEAMPKPDQGNKAVARKLNEAGLEALRRDDTATAIERFSAALRENPRDVEVSGNLGFALNRAGRARDAERALAAALVLDPRRASTWAPLAESYALQGKRDAAVATLWVAYQWSGNREKAAAYYGERASAETRADVAQVYAMTSRWIAGEGRPRLTRLGEGL